MRQQDRSRLRICVVTSNTCESEPRAPRHAAALAQMGPDWALSFVDCAPKGTARSCPEQFSGLPNLKYRTHYFVHRGRGAGRLLWHRLLQAASQVAYRSWNRVWPHVLSSRTVGLAATLRAEGAHLYLGHEIDTLLPIFTVARQTGALVAFDCMEYYSDTGASQSSLERAIIKTLEKELLPACVLLLSSSEELSDALAAEYGIERPLPLYNVPPLTTDIGGKVKGQFSLYWRNATLGLTQRGLDDALVAMTFLPDSVTLHVQGRVGSDGGRSLVSRIAELGISHRVHLHAPHAPTEAVRAAAKYHVGLCLERRGPRNHDLTVSNKMFDYMMAGLPVVAPDLPGLATVLRRSKGGLLYTPGSPRALADAIGDLHRDPSLHARLSQAARSFALSEGNLAYEMARFQNAFLSMIALNEHRLARITCEA